MDRVIYLVKYFHRICGKVFEYQIHFLEMILKISYSRCLLYGFESPYLLQLVKCYILRQFVIISVYRYIKLTYSV